jgi:hypothetical protein
MLACPVQSPAASAAPDQALEDRLGRGWREHMLIRSLSSAALFATLTLAAPALAGTESVEVRDAAAPSSEASGDRAAQMDEKVSSAPAQEGSEARAAYDETAPSRSMADDPFYQPMGGD